MLLIAAGAVVVVLILIVAGLAAWLSFNFDEIRETGSRLEVQGRELGPLTDQDGCLGAALHELDQSAGLTGEVGVRLFLRACLEEAGDSAGFCEGVPPIDEVFDSAMWQLERCREEGREASQPCSRLMGVLQEACAPQRK